MTPTNILGTQIPVGRTLFLAWLTASLLYVFPGKGIPIPDVSPVELGLIAGLVYGYYLAILIILIIMISLFMLLFSLVLSKNRYFDQHIDRTFTRIYRVAEVSSIVVAILVYSDTLLFFLGPLGIGCALVLYMLGIWNMKEA